MGLERVLKIAIHKHCIECNGGSRQEVKLCQIPDCPLYLFRCPDAQKIRKITKRGNNEK